MLIMWAVLCFGVLQAATTDLGVRARKPVLVKKEVKRKEDCKFQCGGFACNYGSDNRTHFRDHIRKHTGEKPFKCDFCEHRAAQKSNLRKHVSRYHNSTPVNGCISAISTPLLSSSPDAVTTEVAEGKSPRYTSKKKQKRDVFVIVPTEFPSMIDCGSVFIPPADVIVVEDADCADEMINVDGD